MRYVNANWSGKAGRELTANAACTCEKNTVSAAGNSLTINSKPFTLCKILFSTIFQAASIYIIPYGRETVFIYLIFTIARLCSVHAKTNFYGRPYC
jgi:hypothetical protein